MLRLAPPALPPPMWQVFPAGIIQPPFFAGWFPSVLNFAGIGMVMGHELSHGFDDQGAQYDGDGNLSNWWTPQALASFKTRADCVAAQYSAFTVEGVAEAVNGNLTLGENLADNAGLALAYGAWQRSSQRSADRRDGAGAAPGKPAETGAALAARMHALDPSARDARPGAGGALTQPQLFWVSFAQNWCTKMTSKAELQQILTDPHSPARWRVNGPVQNNRAFSADFGCAAGAPMNPARKCTLWDADGG